MTSYELFELHKEIIEELSEIRDYINDLKKISTEVSESSNVLMQPILKNGLDSIAQNTINTERARILKTFQLFIAKFDILSNHEILIKLKQAIFSKKNLKRFEEFDEEFSQIDQIIDSIDDTTKKIYEYVKTKDAGLLVEVLNTIGETTKLYDVFDNSFRELNRFISRIEHSHGLLRQDGYSEATIHFYNDNTNFSDLLNNLIGVKNIYDELRAVFNIQGYDLQIIKIESGSLLERVLGKENIIECLTYLLKKCVDLIFNKFTLEGKITRKKELMEYIEKSVGFIQKCKELGLEIAEEDKQKAQENISKAYAIISGDILRMVAQSAKIKINDEEFSITEKLSDKFLEEGKQLKLNENATN